MSSGLPIIADADTGFGEEEMVYKTVIDYFQAGAYGILIRSTYRGLGFSKKMRSLRRKEINSYRGYGSKN